jgi:hydrogenase expression/formation protein HypC
MCLAIPAKVLELLPDEMARVDISGAARDVSLALLEDAVQPGDYVLLHVGYAIEKIDEEEARKTLTLFRDMYSLENEIGTDVPAPLTDSTEEV